MHRTDDATATTAERIAAASATLASAVSRWPELTERQRAAAFATALDAIEGVEWLPFDQQYRLFAAKTALLAGSDDDLSDPERLAALADAERHLARIELPPKHPASSVRGRTGDR